MTIIQATTVINARIEACFRLSLNIDLELQVGANGSIRAVGGITSGNIGAGEHVTWRTKQFGFWVTHTSEITGFDEPTYFQDSMLQGVFRSFHHDHYFRSVDLNRTEMRDHLRFAMPTMLMGRIAEQLLVKRRLTTLLLKRNTLIKRYAEAGLTCEQLPSFT
jgi:ligand-binding SRPBCC domain-containing protein